MKILFIQLPLLDHARGYLQGNIEYGPSSIAAYIDKNFRHKHDLQILPAVLTNFCSDSVIIRYIENYSPDIISFSCFLWNVERQLAIAVLIKKRFPGIKIIFGGPEITRGSFILETFNPSVDIYFSGEGEWFFERFLSGLDLSVYQSYINGNLFMEQPSSELIQADEIVEPLSGNRMNSMCDGSVFIELTRGCPYGCEYCYYSKNGKKVREIPFSHLTDVLQTEKNISEIYILSPSFNRTRDFRKSLEELADLNHGVNLHTEMKAAGIDRETAVLIRKAGFKSLEVGLQTLTKKALKTVGRRGDPLKEIAGMKILRDAGIDLKIGIIPGLPGDSVEGFYETVDLLIEEGFSEQIELYQLMVLPGTLIRDRALRDGVSFQQKPPYYFLEGWGFSEDDIAEITSSVEEQTGNYQSIYSLPDFTEGDGLFCCALYFDADISESWIAERIIPNIETNIFSFHIKAGDILPLNKMRDLISFLPESELFNFIIYSDLPLQENNIRELLYETETDCFYGRINIHQPREYAQRHRFYHVTESKDLFLQLFDSYEFIEPVLSLSVENIALLKLLDPYDISVFVKKGIYEGVRETLVANFQDCTERVGFSSRDEHEDFLKKAGVDYVNYPFTFSVKKI